MVQHTRKEKPDWFKLIDKLKAIVSSGAGTFHDLTAFVDVAPARYFEWISGKIEPKAQTVLMIQKWIAAQEELLKNSPVKGTAYRKALANPKKS